MAIQVGDPVYVARGGKHRGMVESVRPGQILVRLESGEASWVGDGQVSRRPLALRSSRPPPSSAAAARVFSGALPSGAPNPYAAPRAPNFSMPSAAPEEDFKWLLFSFEGRIARGRYWLTQLSFLAGIMGLGIVLGLITYGASGGADTTNSAAGMSVAAIAALVFVAILMLPGMWISLAVQTKRWHDRGKSGWWNLIHFIPYIGGIWTFIECGCLRGTIGTNVYGDDPLE